MFGLFLSLKLLGYRLNKLCEIENYSTVIDQLYKSQVNLQKKNLETIKSRGTWAGSV